MPQSPMGKPAGPPIVIGEKAVVGGDVIGSKHEVKVLGGSYTSITHSDESKKVCECAVCHSNLEIVHGGTCPACNHWVCRSCFNEARRACLSCDQKKTDKNEAEYRGILEEVYHDNRVDEHERVMLRKEALRLGISPEESQKLEAAFRKKMEGDAPSKADSIRIKDAEEALYDRFDIENAYKRLQPLFSQYQRRNVRLWRAYLYCLVEYNPEEALQFIEALDVDDAFATAQRIELLMRKQDFVDAEQLRGRAQTQFPDRTEWNAIEVELLLEEYRLNRSRSLLEGSRKLIESVTEQDLDFQIAKACLAQFEGKESALEQLFQEQSAGSEQAFRVLRKQKWIRLGKLHLVMCGAEYLCKSGAIIGRQGTVAVDKMSGIGTLSRRHAQLLVRGGAWNLLIFESTNPSAMDGQQLRAGQCYPLTATHRIRLSSQCEFELRVSPISAAM